MLLENTSTGSTRDAAATALRRSSLVAVAANVVALVVFVASPHSGEYPTAALGIVAFLLVQLLLPACRPNTDAPLCPGNIAQAFFWVQLVLVALLIGFSGVREGTLPRLPSHSAINMAIHLRVLAYLAFSVGYQVVSRPVTRAPTENRARPAAMTPWLVVVFLGLGVLGQFLAYESLAGFIEYVSSPALQKEREAQPTTTAGAASTFLRPFLGFAMVLLWSWWLRRGDRPPSVPACAASTAGLVVLLLLANFSYNRGSMVAPVLAVAAAYSFHVRRISVPAVALAGTVVLFVALAFGWYRSANLEVQDLATTDLSQAWSEDQITEFFQIYASGPQMTAYLIEERGEEAPLYWGRTLVCSSLYPVPVLGKGYRDESGVAILNMLIYQDPENLDQIIAYDAELYINFHAAGVVVGYALLGCLIAFFQARFVRSRQPIDSYIWLTVSLWVVFPGSLPVISQICVYFFWPAYLYLALTWMTSAGRHSEDDAQSVGRSPLGDSFPDESRPGFIAS